MSNIMLRWSWRTIPDPFVGRHFVISPIFGSLHSVLLDKRGTQIYPLWFWSIGCTKRSFSNNDWLNETDVEQRQGSLPKAGDPRHDNWCREVKSCFTRWPFLLAVKQVDKLFERHKCNLPHKTIDESELIIALGEAWIASQEPECLPRSIYRLGWLRALGRYPNLVIGVHTPTDRLHAWIELDGMIIGEDYDEMLCFQGGVRYYLSP